jgi:hypothetical protein
MGKYCYRGGKSTSDYDGFTGFLPLEYGKLDCNAACVSLSAHMDVRHVSTWEVARISLKVVILP